MTGIIIGIVILCMAYTLWNSYRFSCNLDLKIARAEGFLAGVKTPQDAKVTELPDGRKVHWVEGVWDEANE